MPETQHVEWKASWQDDHLKWICAFANAEGGVLHIGRNDKGAVVGLEKPKKLLEDLPNKTRDALGILVDVHLRREAGKSFLEISVEAYPNPISYRGRYYRRSGSTLQEIKGAITYEGIVRVERFPVPRAELREAVLNAVVHRDYSVPAPLQIRVYDDRLTLWNPAVLPEGWTQETLLAPHGSQPFNPDIANTFFRAGEHRARMRRGSMPQAARRARRAKRARQIEAWGARHRTHFRGLRRGGYAPTGNSIRRGRNVDGVPVRSRLSSPNRSPQPGSHRGSHRGSRKATD